MLDPLVKTITVPCSQQHAFKVFIEQVGTWWPKDKNSVSAMNGEVAKEIVIEPKLNGRVYEIGHDDAVHEWGSVTAYDPHGAFSLDWHIGLPKESASDVTVRFTAESDSSTKVELVHSRWEAFGDKAQDMRDGYSQGWVGVFEGAFAAACSASS